MCQTHGAGKARGEKERAHIDGLVVDRADDIDGEVVNARGEPGQHEDGEQRGRQPPVLRVARHLGALHEDVIDVVAQEHHRPNLHKAARTHTHMLDITSWNMINRHAPARQPFLLSLALALPWCLHCSFYRLSQ